MGGVGGVAEVLEREVRVIAPQPHAEQAKFITSTAKRKIVKAGRRGGKTYGVGIAAADSFCQGRRVLYTAPTSEQTDAFWSEIKRILRPLTDITWLYKINETERYIERIGTRNRIKAKTAWNADTLRGDYADLLIFDEYQLTNEDAWEVVGQPMLLDNNGDAIFIYTPPSLRFAGVSKARDPRHAAKLFAEAQRRHANGENWETFHFTSWDNPHISHDALTTLTHDMSREAYRQEIMAEDDDIQLSWLVYKAFNETLCRIKRFEIPKTWPVFSGHDFGSANPAALFFAHVRLPLPHGAPAYMRLNDLVCFKEYLPGATSAPNHVNAWKLLTAGYRVEMSVGGNQNTEEQTRQLYRMHGWPIQAPEIKAVNAQIDRVIGLMELNKVYNFEDNIYWHEELMNCLWELDNEGRTTNKVRDEAKYHLSACARYLLSNFTPETAVGQDNHPHSLSRADIFERGHVKRRPVLLRR
mgnify:CR=1 FL=1